MIQSYLPCIANVHPSNTCFFGPTWVHNANGISIDSDLLHGSWSIVRDRQTDWMTDQAILHVWQQATSTYVVLRCGLKCKKCYDASTDPTESKQNTAVDSIAWLLHPRVLYYVHVVEPDVLHASGEVLSRPQTLSDLQEVVQSTDVDLTFITDWISYTTGLQSCLHLTLHQQMTRTHQEMR